ncbi:hypothetical protein D3C81_2164290 [compost metagenome]
MEAAGVLQRYGTLLVLLQRAKQTAGIADSDHLGEIMGDEPGSVIDHHGAQAKVVAEENERGICVLHGEDSLSG